MSNKEQGVMSDNNNFGIKTNDSPLGKLNSNTDKSQGTQISKGKSDNSAKRHVTRISINLKRKTKKPNHNNNQKERKAPRKMTTKTSHSIPSIPNHISLSSKLSKPLGEDKTGC